MGKSYIDESLLVVEVVRRAPAVDDVIVDVRVVLADRTQPEPRVAT